MPAGAAPPSVRIRWWGENSTDSATDQLEFGDARARTCAAPDANSTLQLHIPITRIAGVWTPYGDRSQIQKVGWHGRLIASPCFKPGLLAFVTRDLENRLALMTLPAEAEADIQWDLDQAAAEYIVRIRWAKEPGIAPAVILSTASKSVHDVVSAMAAEPPNASPPPLKSYEPAYCTWYAFHGDMDQHRMDQAAALAATLGFGTFILDDGWSYDHPQRVGAALGKWHRFQGDYQPSRRKFPDFRAHVQYVRSLGLRYLLWVAPLMIGEESHAYAELRGELLDSWLNEGFEIGDPRSARFFTHVHAAISRLVLDYPIDGFKVDYDYALLAPDNALHGLGGAYAAFVRRLVEDLRKLRPDLEWNLLPNLFAPHVTSALRCVDVPFDPETNRFTMANLRAISGRAALQYDPSLWSPHEPAETVHRHLVPSLFGVPSVGAPLLELPPEHREAVASWLRFYRRHQHIFNHGKFKPIWSAGDYQSFHATLGHEQISAAFSPVPVEVGKLALTTVVNCSGAFVLLDAAAAIAVTVADADGREIIPARRLAQGIQRIECPAGSVLRVTC